MIGARRLRQGRPAVPHRAGAVPGRPPRRRAAPHRAAAQSGCARGDPGHRHGGSGDAPRRARRRTRRPTSTPPVRSGWATSSRCPACSRSSGRCSRRDRVRFAGEPVVAVVATSRAIAEDALELVVVDLEPLPAVVDPAQALAPDATLLYPEWGTNELLHLEAASPGLADAIAAAPHVLRERFESHRIMGLPLEGHGAQAEYDAATDLLTMIASTQQPHQLRTVVAEVCGMTEASVRVDRARHGWRVRQQAALPPRGVPGGDARPHHRCPRAVGRGPQRGADRVGALAPAGARRHRRVRRRRPPARVVGRRDQRRRQPGPVLLGHRPVVGDRRRAVRRVRSARSTAGRCRVWRRRRVRSARTAGSDSRRRTSPSSG